MKVIRQDVDYVAELAHLELTEEESARMERDLNSILDYIDTLAELDTTGIEPMAQVAAPLQASQAADDESELRADQLRPSLPHDAALANAPNTDGTFFKVPKVIER
ncbi:MAG TPA: Asp-tRNA(Asn)/Glu-tRNA(Gln) amidotransferase subunit GatC [Terriglobales bacterium]|jgi:aspartyl-tRNA(Asn)/glutamyl-tRNA(Gln) amidotransferase subunit C